MEKHGDKLSEQHHLAYRHGDFHQLTGAVVQNQANGDLRKALVERAVQRFHPGESMFKETVLFVDLGISVQIVLLSIRKLNYLQAREIFLQILVEAGKRLACLAKQKSGLASKKSGHQCKDRQSH